MVNKEVIYGRNSVIEALKSPRITAEKLYIPQTEVDPALAKIRRLAESMGIPCKSADKKKLDDMAKKWQPSRCCFKSSCEILYKL
jgi:tRNA G18 (ribose-2'-O)-methylase SpoU